MVRGWRPPGKQHDAPEKLYFFKEYIIGEKCYSPYSSYVKNESIIFLLHTLVMTRKHYMQKVLYFQKQIFTTSI